MARILLVDDDKGIVEVLSMVLQANDYDVVEISDSMKARELMLEETFDLLISDLRMEPVNGMELLTLAHEKTPLMPVLMLTGNATLATATEALKLGAFDYILKPFRVDDLLTTVQMALDYGEKLKTSPGSHMTAYTVKEPEYQFGRIIAQSEAMQDVCAMIRKVVPVDTPVLIYGERGTGKQAVGRVIHEQGARKDKNFICINFDAIPGSEMALSVFQLDYEATIASDFANQQGIFSGMDGGTLMFKKIGSMPSKLQKDILKVLQGQELDGTDGKKRCFNVRLIAGAENRLHDLAAQGRLREDLAFKLGAIAIELKPLRERVKDILPLVCHFILKSGCDKAKLPVIDPDVVTILELYPWPGNICEMQNVVDYAMENLNNGRMTHGSIPREILDAVHLVDTKPAENTDMFRGKALRAFIRKKAGDNLKSGLTGLKSQSNGDSS